MRAPQPHESWLRVGARSLRVRFVRNLRARRYILRLRPEGSARVTIPRGGSLAEAQRFAERNVAWLEQELLRQTAARLRPKTWLLGTEILFRGEPARLELGADAESKLIRLGSESLRVDDASGDLRAAVENHLRLLAERELPARAGELAALHQVAVKRVQVRSQRSRWGSCSRRGTISLNWRLVQTPIFVRDYIILHELAHVKEMNHSPRFWREMARLCPDFAQAERWLKQNSKQLL